VASIDTSAPTTTPDIGGIGDTRVQPNPQSTGGKDWWGVAWFALGTICGAHLLSDNSFLTHLATGRQILDGHIPHADPYSYTRAGTPWVVQSWLYSVVDAGLEEAFGAWAIRLFLGVVIGLLLATIWRLSRPAVTLVGRVAVTAAAGAVGIGYWNERPQTLAFLLMACTLVMLTERWRAVWLVPVFALWVNVHGSWPIGLGVVALVLVQRLVADRRLTAPTVNAGLAAVLGCLAGAAVSPFGVDLLVFPLRLLGRGEVLRYIVEWRPPEPADLATLALVVQVLVAVWAIWRTKSWGWAPLVIVMSVLAATGRRNIPVASLAMVPVMAPAIGSLALGTLRVGAPLARRQVVAAWATIAIVVGVVVAAMPNDYDLGPYPVAAVSWMQSHQLVADPDVRLVHPDYVGNYLEWRYGPDARVFADDRAEVLSPRLISDYVLGLLDTKRDWSTVLDRYDANVVVWPASDHLAREVATSPEWIVSNTSSDGTGRAWIVACRAGTAIVSRCS
jgi:hypothetical protein